MTSLRSCVETTATYNLSRCDQPDDPGAGTIQYDYFKGSERSIRRHTGSRRLEENMSYYALGQAEAGGHGGRKRS